MSYPGKSIGPFFIPEVARQKGFFREQGIDIQLTYVRAGGIDLAALLSGDLDYTIGGTSTINGFVAGAPVRLVMSYLNGTDLFFIGNPKYRTPKELKGQVVGAQNPGGMINIMVAEILRNSGLNPDRDVTVINLGGNQDRYISLKTGAAAATILGTPHSFRAEREGFRRLAAGTDYVPGFTGMGTCTDQISKKPDQLKRVSRALLKAMSYIRQNRQEMVAMIAREFTMEPDIAQSTYELLLDLMSPDGTFNLKGLQFFIDLARERQKIQKEIPASQVVELAILKEAQREIGMAR